MRSVAVGDRVSQYVLEEEVGRGGFGVVFRARHRSFKDRVVAIKVVLGEEQGRALRNEALLQDLIEHPRAVKVLDLDAEHDPPYMIMEYVAGESLRARLARENTLDPIDALQVCCDLLEPLAAAHAKGIVHRDLKPSNVLLDSDGRAKLTDFGLGRALGDEVTLSMSLASMGGEVVGTMGYMAPEQKVAGEVVDARADVYAFGVLLFELLTGSLPEGGEVPTDLDSNLPSEVDRIFRQCYCRRAKRYCDAGAVRVDVRALLARLREAAARTERETPEARARTEREAKARAEATGGGECLPIVGAIMIVAAICWAGAVGAGLSGWAIGGLAIGLLLFFLILSCLNSAVDSYLGTLGKWGLLALAVGMLGICSRMEGR